jgi:hypothetical protein
VVCQSEPAKVKELFLRLLRLVISMASSEEAPAVINLNIRAAVTCKVGFF